MSGHLSTVLDGKASGIQTPATQVTDPTVLDNEPNLPEQVPPTTSIPALGGLQFWLIFIALMVTMFLSAIDLVGSPFIYPSEVFDLSIFRPVYQRPCLQLWKT